MPRTLLLLLLALWPLSAAAQQSPGPAKKPDQEASDMAARRRALDEAAARLEASLGLLEQGRAALTDPAPATTAPVVSADAPLSQKLEAELAAIGDRRDRLAARLKSLESLESGLERGLAVLDEALERNQSYRSAAAALGEALIAPKLGPEARKTLLAGSGFSGAAELTAALRREEERARSWSEQKAALARERAALPTVRASLTRDLAASQAAWEARRRALDEARRREAYARELSGKAPAALIGLLLSKLEERKGVLEALEARRIQLDKAQASLEDAAKTLEKVRPEEVAPSSRIPRVREAESAVLLAESLARYHRQALAALDSQQKALDELASALDALDESRAPARALQGDLEVLTAVIDSQASAGLLQPGDLARRPPAAELEQQRRSLAGLAKRSRALRPGLAAQQARGLTARKEAEAAIKEQEAKLQPARAALERENKWARFIRKVEKDPSPVLLETLERSRKALQEAQATLATRQATLAAAEAAVAEHRRQRDTIEDPLTRRARARYQSERREIVERLFRSAGLAAPAMEASPAAEVASPAENAGAGRLKGLTDQQVLLAQRQRYQEQLAELAQRQASDLEALIAAREALGQQFGALLEAARQVYGCVEEVRIRVGLGALAAESLPKEASDSMSREQLLTLEQGLAEAGASLEQDRARLAESKAFGAVIEQRRAAYAAVQEALAAKIAWLSDRERLYRRVTHRSEALSDFDRKVLDDAAEELERRDNPWWQMLLGLFNPPNDSELAKQLSNLYRRVADIDQQQQILSTVEGKTRQLIASLAAERDPLRGLLPHLRTRLAEKLRDEGLAEAAAQAALNPSKAAEILAAAEKAHGEAPKPPAELNAASLSRLADELFEARAGLKAFQERIANIERRCTTAGLREEVGPYEEDIGRFEAKAKALSVERSRLKGHGGEPDPEADSALGEGSEKWYRLGEIGVLRWKRRRARLSQLQRSMLSLIVIPLVAAALIILSRRLTLKLIARVGRSAAPPGAAPVDDDEEVVGDQRLQTLVGVAGTAWKFLVIILAGIYLLKQFGFDITPLIASAGVLGLAIAFGAQNLVKDFFTGFTILLENQYKIGDYVTIAGLEGYVEGVSLRLTIMRDKEGKRHFIPNGSIAAVTNHTQVWSGFNVDIGVAYHEDPDLVINCLRGVCLTVYEDPVWRRRLHRCPKVLGVESFGDSSVTIRIHTATRPGKQWDVARELRRRIKHAFVAEGIEIPFPQRVIHYAVRPEEAEAAAPEPTAAPEPPATGDQEESAQRP